MDKAIRKVMTGFCLTGMLFLSACGISPETRAEANQLLVQYEPDYCTAVADTFGEDAKLTNVKGEIVERQYDFKCWYEVSGYLTGMIRIDGQFYKSKYDTESGTLLSDYHKQDIIDEFIDVIGFDNDEVYPDVRLTVDRFGRDCMLSPNATDLKSALDESYLMLSFGTPKDLSNVSEADFDGLSAYCEDMKYGFDITILYNTGSYDNQDVHKIEIKSNYNGGYDLSFSY